MIVPKTGQGRTGAEIFAISKAIVVIGACPSYGCCSIEYFSSRLDLIPKFDLESIRFAETAYSVIVTVGTTFDSFG